MKPIPQRALAGVLSQPWAIQPEWLKTITEIVQRHGEDPTGLRARLEAERQAAPEALAARRGAALENTFSATERGGVAVIPVTGPIFPRANLITEFSGGTSLDLLANDFREAQENDRIRATLLDFDTPGGVAFEIADMADMFAAAEKPVTAFVGGMGASAGFWLASAAGEVVASKTALLGSIGVVMALQVQEEPDRDGFREFEIVSSNAENKRPDPRQEAGLAELQRTLDDLEAAFVGAVAAFRGVPTETVLRDFGRGGVLIGPEAVAAGMADRVGSFEDTLAGLASGSPLRLRGRGPTSQTRSTPMAKMTAAEIAAQHPEATEEIRAAVRQETTELAQAGADKLVKEASEAAKAKGLAEGAQAERNRIKTLKAAALPGFDNVLEECIADGKSTVADMAVKTMALQKQQGSTALTAAQQAEASLKDLPAPTASADGGAAADSAAAAAGPVDEETAKAADEKSWAAKADLRAEFGSKDAFLAYQKAQREGRVKVFGAKRAA